MTTTETKNRVANPLLLDVPVQLPEDQRLFLPDHDRVNRVTNHTVNNHDNSRRHFTFNITIGSNNTTVQGECAKPRSIIMDFIGTLIGVGAIIYLLWQVHPFLGEFDRFGSIFKMR